MHSGVSTGGLMFSLLDLDDYALHAPAPGEGLKTTHVFLCNYIFFATPSLPCFFFSGRRGTIFLGESGHGVRVWNMGYGIRIESNKGTNGHAGM